MDIKDEKLREELREKLGSEQFHICCEQGTEHAFSGKFWDHHEEGTYTCAVCDEPLFTSQTKFDSGTGWPSFFQPATNEAVEEQKDSSHGMIRVGSVDRISGMYSQMVLHRPDCVTASIQPHWVLSRMKPNRALQSVS